MIRGIGGVFIYADDAPALVQWYTQHLGIAFDFEPSERSYYRDFVLPLDGESGRLEREVFAIRQADVRQARTSSVVINLRVQDSHLGSLGAEVSKVETYDYGRFAWLKDGEGNQLELFESS
jgi:D-3-phosphoglycerate dehydrogenase / 2-oxoglutarate reductase